MLGLRKSHCAGLFGCMKIPSEKLPSSNSKPPLSRLRMSRLRSGEQPVAKRVSAQQALNKAVRRDMLLSRTSKTSEHSTKCRPSSSRATSDVAGIDDAPAVQGQRLRPAFPRL